MATGLQSTQEVLEISAQNSGAVQSTQEVLEISAVVPTAVAGVESTQEVLQISVTSPLLGINYPISAPAIAGIGPQDFSMTMANVVGETESPFTYSQQEQQWQGQRFELEVDLPPLTLAQAEQWISFLASLYGKYGTFLMGDYLRPSPQGPWSGAPVVSGNNLNGSNTLNLRGATASITNWAVAGDYVQVTVSGNPQRLYKVVQNASSTVAGNVALTIFPNIRETIADGNAIVTANTAGTFRLLDNRPTWKVDKDKIYKISFKAKEAL
jgi:hypothetical protein